MKDFFPKSMMHNINNVTLLKSGASSVTTQSQNNYNIALIPSQSCCPHFIIM